MCSREKYRNGSKIKLTYLEIMFVFMRGVSKQKFSFVYFVSKVILVFFITFFCP